MVDNISNINTLKEIILDEENIVTYISVSKNLGVHINESKILLQMFLDSTRREKPQLQLNVNYLLSGIVDENKAKLIVCPENDLETIKKTYKLIYFQHIYSISKGLPQTDHAAFFTVNKYNDFSLCNGIIKSEYCIKRSSEEINSLKNSQEITEQKPSIPQKKSVKIPVTKIGKTNSDQKVVETELSNEKTIKKEIVSPQKENINKLSTNRSAPQKKIAGFFNKQNGITNKKENKEPEKNTKTIKPIIKKEENNIQDKMDVDENKIKSISKVDTKSNNEVNGNNKVLNQIKKTSKVDKKRKRVLHVSDSESDGENDPFVNNDEEEAKENIQESDDEIPPTPAASNLKITTGIVNPRKKRKVVDKTYMSDDGYIITKREEVYESCSDGETNIEAAPVKMEVNQIKTEVSPKSKPKEIKTKKKVSPPQKGKQSSIMNFFKKN